MPGNLVVLMSYGTPAEARIAFSLLQEAGIDATLEGEAVGSSLNFGSALGGVKLLVRNEDVARAEEVLFGDEDGATDAPSGETWVCPTCENRVAGTMDVCWSCGSARGEMDGKPRGLHCRHCGAQHAKVTGACAVCGREFQDGVDDSPDREPSEASIALHRAWRASLIGFFVLPPLLHVYSLTQLIEYRRVRARDGTDDDWRAFAAFVIDVAAVIGGIAFYRFLFRF